MQAPSSMPNPTIHATKPRRGGIDESEGTEKGCGVWKAGSARPNGPQLCVSGLGPTFPGAWDSLPTDDRAPFSTSQRNPWASVILRAGA